MNKQLCSLLLAGVLMMTGLVGCGSTSSDEDLGPVALKDYDAEIGLKKRWTAQIGNGQGDNYNRLLPALSGDNVIVAAVDGSVSSVSKTDGSALWQIKLSDTISGGAYVIDGLVILGNIRGELIALSVADGQPRWRSALSSEIVGVPAADGDLLVARSNDGQVYGLDVTTGTKRWSYTSSLPVLTLRGYGSPVFYEDLVIVGLANGKLMALDRETGVVRWENRVALGQGKSEIERLVDIDATPLILGSMVVAASYQGNIFAFEADSGRRGWQANVATYNDLAEGFGNIYVVNKDSHLIALSRNDGSFRWQSEELARRRVSAPETLGSYVLVGDYEGYLHVFSQTDGHLASRRLVDRQGLRAPVLVTDSLILAYGNSGKLAAYELSDKFIQLRNTGGIPARDEVAKKRGMHPDWPH